MLIAEKYLSNLILSNFVYLSSTFAPAASNLDLISSASFLFTPDLTSLVPSTKSLASFKPNSVTALTSLITLFFYLSNS